MTERSIVCGLLLCGLLALNRIDPIESVNSGVKMQLTQRGLDYAAGVASVILRRNLIDDDLGGVDEEKGDLKYSVSHVKITDYAQRSTSALVDPRTSSIRWTLALENLKTSADWSYNFNLGFVKVKDSGSLVLEAEDLSIAVSIAFGFDSTSGRPTIRATGCTCSVLDIRLQFHGRNRNLYTIVSSVFKDGIKELVQDELCQAARKEIDEGGNEELSTLVIDVKLAEDFYFDYRLTENPEVKDGYVESSHVGRAFAEGESRQLLPDTQPDMNERPGNEMVSFLISEDSLTTYGRILISKGTRTLINRDDLPENQKEFLSTDCEEMICFVEMMPGLVDAYPGADIEVDYSISEHPKLAIRSAGISCDMNGSATVHVLLSNGTKLQLAAVEIHLHVTVVAKLEEHLLKLNVVGVTPRISLQERLQSRIDEAGLESAMAVLSRIVMSRINGDLNEGIPVIRTRGVAWENTRVEFYDRFLRLAADLNYLRL